jgi:aspartate/methionine/tyrosine aminotransferase
MDLSARTRHQDAPNALTEALRRAREAGRALVDLTTSNPTTADLPYDERAILAALSDPRAMRYEPEPLGLESAREAVARALDASASRVAITASTSEAYAVLFKMLCDPGDEVLVPAPSYPLLDFLADFESVTLRRYPLEYAGGWHLDTRALARAVTARTRAIVVVAPNNPTGQYLGAGELDALLETGLPIVSDEVFATYPLAGERAPEGRVDTVLRARRGLVFALSGLSKLAALPQMKLAWIVAGGDPALAERAMARLEIVLDAYLSPSTPVQHALPALLASRAPVVDAIRRRTRANLALLRDAARGSVATVLDVEGGWYAILRVPETRSDEEWSVRLLEEDGVHVHPGYFFEMPPRGAHLVLSLLTPEPAFAEGVRRVLARVGELA